MKLSEDCAQEPVQRLVTWYSQHQRDLPWRHTRDPYAIWVSEAMLQQTRVETVIPYYHSFLQQFPTVRDLALADEAVVLKAWQGLGYYSRARNLHSAAQVVTERHGGIIPSSVAEFSSLPGVGPYTTGAVLSIAFGQPVPALDGNVLRVMARYLGVEQDISKSPARYEIAGNTEAWLHQADPSRVTQALMELGALVCLPRNPRCTECPLQPECFAWEHDKTHTLPVRPRRRERKRWNVLALWLETERGIVMERRGPKGLLAGLWQLPAWESSQPEGGVDPNDGVPVETLRSHLQEVFLNSKRDVSADILWSDIEFVELAKTRHLFTHVQWDVRLFKPVGANWEAIVDCSFANSRYTVVKKDIMEQYALPRAFERLVVPLLRGPASIHSSGEEGVS